jgi:hypothetical protein
MGSTTLPGFAPDSDAQNTLTNIGEAIWQVIGNLLYIMGAPPTSMVDNGSAGRQAVEKFFASLVTPDDVTNGNATKLNAAANTTAIHFLRMFGGNPLAATGVAAGDLMGSCLAYQAGPSSFYAAQVAQGGTFSPATKCAQLKALMTGSGLNWLQVALGGDGLGGSMTAVQTPTRGAGNNTPTFWDPQTGQPVGAVGSAVAPASAYTPQAYSAPQTQVSSDPVPVVNPVVQSYQPAPTSQLYSPLATTAASSPVPASQAAVQQRQRRQNSNVTPISAPASPAASPSSYPASAPAPVASSTISSMAPTSSSSGGFMDWITANPLIAVAIAGGALFMFSQGGKR